MTTHTTEPSHQHMGLPLTNGKLAMWLFLATEIMFFSGLIGAYIVLRFGTPPGLWPEPHAMMVEEHWGALNTFFLICSSVSVVLAHAALLKRKVGLATLYIAVTLALGGVFLLVKAHEYTHKWEHGIFPGGVFESPVDALKRGMADYRSKLSLADQATDAALKDASDLAEKFALQEIKGLKNQLHAYEDLEKKHEKLHLPHVHPNGNLWASCYFTITGFHALHVLGGMIMFTIMLIRAGLGLFTVESVAFVEYAGLYWHFVDIVWIFLFPLLYLIG